MPNWLVNGDVLENYLQACKDARIEDFKNDWRFRPIFEHTKHFIAVSYVELVRKNNPHLLSVKWTNDTIGDPHLHDISGWYGSNSTAQYMGVISNLIDLFENLDKLDILEIGGGYGGQALGILDIFSPNSYTILDLPEVNDLQYKVLGDQVTLTSTVPKKKYDLIISNYALSELPDQSPYTKLLKRCKHGYITCNTEFVNLDWAHKSPDVDGERPTNYILTW